VKAFNTDTVVKFSKQDYSAQNSGDEVSLTEGFLAVLTRDVVTAFRQRGDMINPVVFFLMVVTMMPLGISPESKALAFLAPGLLWVIALLATLLSLDSLFRSDYDDGSLEQLILSPQSRFFFGIV
jgi:heme exporter protein B